MYCETGAICPCQFLNLAMTYTFEGRTYPSFLGLFYRQFDASLSWLPAPPFMDALPGRAQPPLGYCCIGQGDARRFVPDPKRAPLIAAAFEQVVAGTHFQKARRMAAVDGLTGRSGCRISASGLLHVLRNPAYMGLLRYGQELYAGELEPLVDEMTFKAAVRELDRQTEAFHTERLSRMEKFHNFMTEVRAMENDRILGSQERMPPA